MYFVLSHFLMEKDLFLETLDSSAVKILEHTNNELMPWLNSLRSFSAVAAVTCSRMNAAVTALGCSLVVAADGE